MTVALKITTPAHSESPSASEEPVVRVVPTVFGMLVLKSDRKGAFQSGMDGRPFLYESTPEDGPLFMITHGPQENVMQMIPGLTIEQTGKTTLVAKLGSRLCFSVEMETVAAFGHDAQELVRVFRLMMRRPTH